MRINDHNPEPYDFLWPVVVLICILSAVLWLAGCAPVGRYGESASAALLRKCEPAESVSAGCQYLEIDKGIGLLIDQLHTDGLASEYGVTTALRDSWIWIQADPPPLMLGTKRVYGWTMVNEIHLEFSGQPLWHSAMLHEVAHAILCKINSSPQMTARGPKVVPDCDPGHELESWWLAVRAANRRWENEQ